MNAILIPAALGIPILVLVLVTTLLDLLRDAPWVLSGLLVLLAALGVAVHQGLFGDVAGWIAGHETFVLAAFAVLACLIYPAARLRRYWRFRTLRWPAGLTPEAFQQHCVRFMGTRGWTVGAGIERHGFRATKGETAIQVQCLSVPMTQAAVGGIRRSGETLAVSYQPLPPDVIYQANRQGLRLIHYRRLSALDDVLAAALDAEPPTAWGVLRSGEPGRAAPAT